MPDTISIDIRDHIATVTLQETTMKPAFFAELGPAFDELASNTELRAVVLCAAGKAFSYGLDIPAAFAEFGEVFRGDSAIVRTRLLGVIRALQQGFNAVAACPVPVIAAIHKWCVGGGLDLVSACDIRLASRDTLFSLREAKAAIVADLGVLQRLPRIIGQGFTRELAFTGKDIDAERAQRIGLVNNLYDDHAATVEAAHAMAAEIAANPPLTVRGVKDVLDYSADKTVADGLAYVAAWNAAFLGSEDLVEAGAAFAANRPPRFKGR